MPRKRRRQRRGCFPATVITLLFLAATGCIVYIAATQPEWFNIGGNRQAVPAMVIEDEPSGPESEPEPTAEANPLAEFNFYIADNQQSYESYQDSNPYLPGDAVVWQVNAGLHTAPFTDPEVATQSDPLLVNPYNRLPDDFAPRALEPIDNEGRLATPETINAFRRMQESAAEAGYTLRVQSAYRTIEYQQGLYDRAGGDGAVARPAYSEHHTGRALDLGNPDGTLLDIDGGTPTGQWVAENVHEYGFILRYTAENQHITGYIYEPWHITYVGETIARAIAGGQYGSLEEYVAKNPEARLP